MEKKNKTNMDLINTAGRNSRKANPLIPQEVEVVSKSMRIYESDYKTIRNIAFDEDKSMVEVVKEAVALLKEKKGK